MPDGEKPPLGFGPFQLDPQCGQLRKNGIGLKLQGQPVQILEILLEKPGQLVTREEFRQRLWASDTFVDFDHSLNTAIKKLRQALGEEADTPRYIETLPKRGYRFVGEVSRDEWKAAPDTAPVPSVPVDLAELQPVEQTRPLHWKRAAISSVALLAIAAVVVVLWFVTPLPQPRIVGVHVLTKTGNPKYFFATPFTDRGALYFFEGGPSDLRLFRVPAAGGEVSAGPAVNGDLNDISRDGSQLLSAKYNPERKQWDAWTQSLADGVPRLILKDASNPVWTADARSIFFTRNSNTQLYRANADGTNVQRLASPPDMVGSVHLSPDGSHIRVRAEAGADVFGLWEIGADGSNPHRILGGRKDVLGGTWSPDGKYYFFSSWDGDRWSLWGVSEGQHWWRRAATSPPQPLTFGPLSIGIPAISSDGKQLYAVGREPRGELSVYDAKSGKFVPYLSGSSICFVDFSRDGQWMAYVSYPEGTLWRSRVDGSERRQLTVPPLAVMNPRWSPDGKLIVFTDLSNGDRSHMRQGNSPHRIYAVSADGGGPVLLLAGNVGDPTWSPDGGSIAYSVTDSPPSQSNVQVLDLKTQKSTILPGSDGLWSSRWAPDGKHLVALSVQTITGPKKLMLFNFAVNTWEELASGTNLSWPAWSRDSKFVYAQDDHTLVRIAVSDHKKEQIASSKGFRTTAYFLDRWNVGWFGLTPDDRPITTRDIGIQEIYAFDLEYK